MAVLATQTDVEAALGRSLIDAKEIARANALLLLASAEVEMQTDYRFAPGSFTVTRITNGDNQITLPAKVANVTAIRDIDQNDGKATTLTLSVDYTIRGKVIYLMQSRAVIEIDFTVTATIPPLIAGVVAGIVAATLAGPPVGASGESAGPYSVSYVNSQGKVWLSASDKLILGRYKQPKSALAILQ